MFDFVSFFLDCLLEFVFVVFMVVFVCDLCCFVLFCFVCFVLLWFVLFCFVLVCFVSLVVFWDGIIRKERQHANVNGPLYN